jgi:hypothetical protein
MYTIGWEQYGVREEEWSPLEQFLEGVGVED